MLRKLLKFWLKYKRLFLVLALLGTVSVILWNSYVLFKHVKEQERVKMEIWADAVQKIIESPLNSDVSLPLKIVSKNKDIPVIMTDSTGKILEVYNLKKIQNDSTKLYKRLENFRRQNKPFIVKLDKGSHYIYYGDSKIFKVLTWYPLILVVVFGMFLLIGYLYYHTSRISEQNMLWAGMAKEAAHQIGTPLSSLIGWAELLKLDPEAVPIDEIEKDIYRLQTISRRFSKIGSTPQLFPSDLNEEIRQSVQYFKSRLPAHIKLDFLPSQEPQWVLLNRELFQWVIENLIKNAMDAMPDGGKIEIAVSSSDDYALIDIKDQGTGIPRNMKNKIFEAGFTTKKRGWGLGLSVVKRVIKDMHKSHIFVKESVPGKGSVFRIKLKKIKNHNEKKH